MKIIAALTMVFLPATFMSSVFGMSSLDGVDWTVYVLITIPLTALVIGTWLIWLKHPLIIPEISYWYRRVGGLFKRKRKSGVNQTNGP